MSAEREKCPPFLSGTPFLARQRPCFFSRSSLARACSPTPFHAEERLLALPSIYNGESRFSSPSASVWHQSTSLCPHPPPPLIPLTRWWNQARQFNGGSGLIIYFPRVYGQLFFEHPASAPWFYDLAVMGLSDNPVSCFDVPSFGIFQPSGTRVRAASRFIRLVSTTPLPPRVAPAAALLVFRRELFVLRTHTDLCTRAWLD